MDVTRTTVCGKLKISTHTDKFTGLDRFTSEEGISDCQVGSRTGQENTVAHWGRRASSHSEGGGFTATGGGGGGETESLPWKVHGVVLGEYLEVE